MRKGVADVTVFGNGRVKVSFVIVIASKLLESRLVFVYFLMTRVDETVCVCACLLFGDCVLCLA